LGSLILDVKRVDLFPKSGQNSSLRMEIDQLNNQTYVDTNNEAYKSGFSSDQNIYATVFETILQTLINWRNYLPQTSAGF
jgi:putative glutathione S-transferase